MKHSIPRPNALELTLTARDKFVSRGMTHWPGWRRGVQNSTRFIETAAV